MTSKVKYIRFMNGVQIPTLIMFLISIVGGLLLEYNGNLIGAYGWFLSVIAFLNLALTESQKNKLEILNYLSDVYIVALEQYVDIDNLINKSAGVQESEVSE